MAIRIEHVKKSYGDKLVFSDLNIVFEEHQCTAIMGASGCGKTTLFRMILGLEKQDAGTITGVPPKVAAVFQEDRLCMDLSVKKNIEMVLPAKFPYDIIWQHLKELGLEQCINQMVRELSGGMRRRIAIARAVLTDAQLLLLDEPLKGLDEETKKQTIDYVKKHTINRTVLLITHDEQELRMLNFDVNDCGKNHKGQKKSQNLTSPVVMQNADNRT